MSGIEEELRRFHEQQAKNQDELNQAKERFAAREQAEMPEQEQAKQAWEKLKAETELDPEQQRAAAHSQEAWNQQENDPRHQHGNAYTAQEKLAAHARDTDLKQHALPEMGPEEKAAIMKELSNSLDTLREELSQQARAAHHKPTISQEH
jgi:hypothetical protein